MKKKSIVVLALGILLTLCTFLGLSYAYWRLTKTQENQNVVLTDCFDVTFQGENDINLQNAYPMDDEEYNTFLTNAIPYHFTVTNKCSSMASASINLEVLETSGVKRLPDSAINVLLYNGTKNIMDIVNDQLVLSIYNPFYDDIDLALRYNLIDYPTTQEKVIKEAVSAYNMYNFILAGNSSREFNLLLSMDKDTPPTSEMMNATFESKITVSTSYNNTSGLLQESCFVRNGGNEEELCTDTALSHSNYGINATKLVIQNELKPISNAIASYDESFNKDGSVMSYVVANENDASTYTIYLQGNGNIILPVNSDSLFFYMEKITNIDNFQYLDTSNVTKMYNMFSGMSSLTSLDLSGFDTSNVNNMSWMFQGMSGLTSLDLSNFDTSNVNNMSWMFQGMSSLMNLNLSSFDTSSVTNMSSMFYNMTNLTSLNLSSFDTSSVTNMSSMFADMTSLTSLNLSNFDTSNVNNMSWMFFGMNNLINLNISGFKTLKVTDMSLMFNGLKSLISLDISSFDTSSVTDMSAMFTGMTSLTTLDISNFDTGSVTDMSSMFANMTSLTSLNLSNFDTSSVTNMSSMFSRMRHIKNLDLSGFDTSNVINMGWMFQEISNVTSLDLSNFNTSKVTDMSFMFYKMSELTSLNLSNFNTENVINMDQMFYYASKLSNILYGNHFVYTNNKNIINMFTGCPANKPTHSSWAGLFT